MTLEHSVRFWAGTMVLVSVALGYFVSPYWFLLTTFVGLNLMQSSFTKFCPAEMFIAKLFFKKKAS